MICYYGPTRYHKCNNCGQKFGSVSGPQRLRLLGGCPGCNSRNVTRSKTDGVSIWNILYAWFKDRLWPTKT